MPIKLAKDFPAKKVLENERIFTMDSTRAETQDIRPLKLALVNLMPDKITCEIQFLRLLSQSPLQIHVDFVQMSTHQHKYASHDHLFKFYETLADIENNYYDGIIMTGAPVETMPYEEVDYWPEFIKLLDWSQTHATSVLHVCWGAEAGLYVHYGIDKVLYSEKLFGVYENQLISEHVLTRGFDDVFFTPQSRYTGINEGQIDQEVLEVLANNQQFGSTILASKDQKNVFVLGHFEYDSDTLNKEYIRDHERGVATQLPANYFKEDNPNGKIINQWRAHGFLFYHNWLNDVYQRTPYELNQANLAMSKPKSD